jgi:hypothetical protein
MSAALGRLRVHWPAFALAILAALVALWARHTLFPELSWNRDEPVYLWHVDVLRAGQLTATDGGHPSLFQPWLSARGDGVFFTQYTLGWPLVLLAFTVLTGGAGNALLVGAALAVLGTYAFAIEITHDRPLATIAAALMVGSPLLAIQGGVYLSYLFTLGLGLLFGVCLLRGIRHQRTPLLLVAGLLLGWIFLTRPYDAILWGAAFAAYAAIVHRDRWTTLVRPILTTGLTAVPLVLLTLLYNRQVTGSLLQFPITAADPMDTFGFGPKRLMPTFEVIDYDLGKALTGTAKNAFFLPWFLVGSYVGAVAAVVGLWLRRRDRSTWAIVLVGLVFPVGYFVFWGNWLSSLAARISGPIYFIPLFAPICILIATALLAAWHHRRALGVGVLAALVIGTVPAAISRFSVNRDISVRQAPWRTSVEDLDGRAIVFVADTAPYLLFLNPFSSNGPDLDDRILYATDRSPAMLDLIAEQPDRTPYLQLGSVAAAEVGPREDPYDLEVDLLPVTVERGRSLSLAVEAAPQSGEDRLVVIVEGDGFRTEQEAPADAGASVVVDVPVSDLAPRGHLSVIVGYGADADAARRAPALRHELEYRIVDDVIEVLLPSAAYRNTLVGGELQWRRTPSLPELTVAVSATD